MSFWYPRLTNRGDIAGGNGTVTVRSQAMRVRHADSDIGPGHSPRWLSEGGMLLIGRDEGTVITNQRGELKQQTGYTFNPRVGNVSGIDAGAGCWCGWSNATGLIYNGQITDPFAAPGVIDRRTGVLSYLTPYQDEVKQVIIDGQVVRSAAATEITAGDDAVCWGEYVGPVRRLWGWCPESLGVPVDVSPLPASETLFIGIPVRTPSGMWIVAQTHKGLIVYEWSGHTGYILEGDYYFHDARWTGDRLTIVATDDAGALRQQALTLAEPRIDLSTYYPSSGTPGPEPPNPEPEPAMKPPVVTVDKFTLDDVLEGREFAFHDAANPELNYRARVWVAGGSMYAELTNKEGRAQTGSVRAVHPCSQGGGQPEPPEPPEPQPEPEVPQYFTLKRSDGGYAGVDSHAFLTQTQSVPATFEVVPQPNGKVGLKCNGKFLSAESDDRCKADRESVGEWEEWDEIRIDEDEPTYCYQSWRGKYLSFHDDGSIKADMDDVGGWETLVKAEATGGRLPITGSLQAGSGRIFYDAVGKPWRYRGVSAFPACRRYTDGGAAAIQPFLNAFPGYNVLRIFDYVTWDGTGWESCSVEQWKLFLSFLQPQGWYVELVLLTDDDPARHAHATALVNGLKGIPNLLIEIGNEPQTHKNIDTRALENACNASGLLYSSGNYEANSAWFGRFGTAHTARDEEWPRKGHDLMEYYGGGGPHAKTDPACRAPWIGDEPIRPDEATTSYNKIADFRAYGGVCALLGGGCTFHYAGGRFCELPTAEEAQCRDAMLQGLTVFDADAPNWGYVRIDEQGGSLRTYILGDRCMVRVRPVEPNPQPGWTPIDADGILYRR